MKLIDFNVNNYIHAQLTEAGRVVLHEKHSTLNRFVQEKGGRGFPPLEIQIDKDGFTRFQMWDFMANFGPFCGNGRSLMFNTNIKFESE